MKRHHKFRRMYRRFNQSRMLTNLLLLIIIFLLMYIVTGGRVLFFWFVPFFWILPFRWSRSRHHHDIPDDNDDEVYHV